MSETPDNRQNPNIYLTINQEAKLEQISRVTNLDPQFIRDHLPGVLSSPDVADTDGALPIFEAASAAARTAEIATESTGFGPVHIAESAGPDVLYFAKVGGIYYTNNELGEPTNEIPAIRLLIRRGSPDEYGDERSAEQAGALYEDVLSNKQVPHGHIFRPDHAELHLAVPALSQDVVQDDIEQYTDLPESYTVIPAITDALSLVNGPEDRLRGEFDSPKERANDLIQYLRTLHLPDSRLAHTIAQAMANNANNTIQNMLDTYSKGKLPSDEELNSKLPKFDASFLAGIADTLNITMEPGLPLDNTEKGSMYIPAGGTFRITVSDEPNGTVRSTTLEYQEPGSSTANTLYFQTSPASGAPRHMLNAPRIQPNARASSTTVHGISRKSSHLQ